MDNYLELLKLILPEFLVEYFDLVKTEKKDEVMHLYFEEQHIIPIQENHRILISHGFYNEITIQDFPLRGNSVYLHVKRRRWLDENTREVYPPEQVHVVMQMSYSTVSAFRFL